MPPSYRGASEVEQLFGDESPLVLETSREGALRQRVLRRSLRSGLRTGVLGASVERGSVSPRRTGIGGAEGKIFMGGLSRRGFAAMAQSTLAQRWPSRTFALLSGGDCEDG